MIYVFYNNDPLAQDQGGGAEHFRGLHRALLKSGLEFHLVAARLQQERAAQHITYVSESSNFLRFFCGLWLWFWRNRKTFRAADVFHFHRNYAAWPKLIICPEQGRVLISYHNVSGRVLEGWLGRVGRPLRRAMLLLERRAVRLADAIICVSGRDRNRCRRRWNPPPSPRPASSRRPSTTGSSPIAPPRRPAPPSPIASSCSAGSATRRTCRSPSPRSRSWRPVAWTSRSPSSARARTART
ncbi:MAG: glycosyltransferase family 4 protein [Geminicoccaceae bacterium]